MYTSMFDQWANICHKVTNSAIKNYGIPCLLNTRMDVKMSMLKNQALLSIYMFKKINTGDMLGKFME